MDPSSETKRTSICFAYNREGGWWRREWYIFDISSEDHKFEEGISTSAGRWCLEVEGLEWLIPKAFIYDDEASEPGWAVVGHHVYILGGAIPARDSCFKRDTKCVRRNDLLSPVCDPHTKGSLDDGWRIQPRMLSPRSHPKATAVVGGKIYVFGGLSDSDRRHRVSDRHPWAEVYDPKPNKWMPLPHPPSVPKAKFLLAASWEEEETNNCYIAILSIRDRVLLLYDVANHCWTQSELPNSIHGAALDFPHHGQAVVAGGLFCWFAPSTRILYAYDLERKILHTSSPLDPKTFADVWLDGREEPMLGHLGGNTFFLLFTCRPKLDDPTKRKRKINGRTLQRINFLHCLKFNVTFSAPNGINISLASCQSYLLNAGYVRNGFTSTSYV
ncbi:hypothetical protein Tsubulata_016835 [Turnera subulata]|uniref:Uncharacterized protein n=1 Tax=Turnera subulata TaxID=218843 RepID=A0A9Q0FAC7_9ROSI|nr:hypothetical protein Tsubulata_016835 [Turnera subulata]